MLLMLVDVWDAAFACHLGSHLASNQYSWTSSMTGARANLPLRCRPFLNAKCCAVTEFVSHRCCCCHRHEPAIAQSCAAVADHVWLLLRTMCTRHWQCSRCSDCTVLRRTASPSALLPRSTSSVADMQVAAKTGIIIRVARRLDELME